jgi:hypothetical protein
MYFELIGNQSEQLIDRGEGRTMPRHTKNAAARGVSSATARDHPEKGL